jgi:LysR family transcriptional regulator, glycine cleavage system transcriptional activator
MKSLSISEGTVSGSLHALPLNALRTFEAAARLESFKDAAAELGVSTTTVSNLIRALERDWGCLLFIRRTRQVILTDTGLSLSRVVRDALHAISREIEQHVTASRQMVAIAVGPIFGTRWLAARLQAFTAVFPHLTLTLQHRARITSATDMPTPIAVDWGLGDWPGLDAEPLFPIRYTAVAAPALAAGLREPIDLAGLPVLHQHDRSEWNAWLNQAGVPGLRFGPETIITDSNIVTHAALAGQGVALGILPFVQDDIDAGRLVRLFPQTLAPSRTYHLVTRPGARRRPEIAAVCDWLLREAAAYRAEHKDLIP